MALLAKKRPAIDVGILFGSPKKGGPGEDSGPMGPDEDFKDLAHTVLDGSTPMAARIDALHELITTVCEEHYRKQEGEEHEEPEEGPESERY